MDKFTTVKIEIYAPENAVSAIKNAAHSIGAGSSELYDKTATEIICKGFWRSLDKAKPYIGETNKLTSSKEIKIEIQCTRGIVSEVISAIKKAHPYEVPVINIIPLANHLFSN